MRHKLLFLSLLGILSSIPSIASAAETAPAASEADQGVLRFAINQYVLDGATLLTPAEINVAVAPYVGKEKDFSDIERALEAVENAYAKRGFSAVRVLLPEQELEKGTVHFQVVETHYGKVTVKDNHFVSEANALNAVPSVRSGAVPVANLVSRELKLANENPARQMNVVLKPGATDDELDASVVVTDSKPSKWTVSADNTGTSETGLTRLGLSYLNANAFGADHVATFQYQTSPEYTERVQVFGAGYKIPYYRYASSLELFAGYSNVNAVTTGLTNFQGGGTLFSARYNHFLERMGPFDPTISAGLDWRDFRKLDVTFPTTTTLYNEIVVTPANVAFAAQAKFTKSTVNFNVTEVANIAGADKGNSEDFANYDKINSTSPNPNYKVLRYSADYTQLIGNGWQFRSALNGQHSSDVLIQGEQIRLGGMDEVRGFTEGSEAGDSGLRLNLEGYTPDFGRGNMQTRALVFYDAGQATPTGGDKTTIASAGVGLRANYGERYSFRCDVARIAKGGTDPDQQSGKKRAHLSFTATF